MVEASSCGCRGLTVSSLRYELIEVVEVCFKGVDSMLEPLLQDSVTQ